MVNSPNFSSISKFAHLYTLKLQKQIKLELSKSIQKLVNPERFCLSMREARMRGSSDGSINVKVKKPVSDLKWRLAARSSSQDVDVTTDPTTVKAVGPCSTSEGVRLSHTE